MPKQVPPMTSKQAKKRYLERTRGPIRTREEQREWEREEQAKIRQEIKEREQEERKRRDAERAANRARRQREAAKERAEAQKKEKRAQGLPVVAPKEGQDTITQFFGHHSFKKQKPSVAKVG